MKQLFLSLIGPSGGEGLSDGGPGLRYLVPSALPPVSGTLLLPGLHLHYLKSVGSTGGL